MTSSVKVKVENLTVFCPYAYTYVCQISKHLIEPFQSNFANKKVGQNKKNKINNNNNKGNFNKNIRWSVLDTAHLINNNNNKGNFNKKYKVVCIRYSPPDK